MRLQVVSDLHMERPETPAGRDAFPALAPYLALLGDVGDPFDIHYSDFLAEQSRRFEHVFVVLGNHEYYGHDGDALERVRQLAPPNVHVLEKQSFEVDGVRVLGTTLWSDMDEQCSIFMSDLRCIPGWSRAKNNAEHRVCVEWLARELEDPRPAVVLTHHAPMKGLTSHPRHAGSVLESGFATDLAGLVRAPVRAWFHGHTHWSHAHDVGGVLLASNAAGLALEATGYDPCRVFQV